MAHIILGKFFFRSPTTFFFLLIPHSDVLPTRTFSLGRQSFRQFLAAGVCEKLIKHRPHFTKVTLGRESEWGFQRIVACKLAVSYG